jgi:hypothetical protein
MECNFQTVGSPGTASLFTLNAAVNSSISRPESLHKASVGGNPNGRPNVIDMVRSRDGQEERVACLEAIVAILIEKNQRMRLQLMQCVK